VRGGGERGLGRSSGAGAATDFDVGCADDKVVVDPESSRATKEDEAPMSVVMAMGCALTKSDEAEPTGSENGSVVRA
jgi:hypothetical protein